MLWYFQEHLALRHQTQKGWRTKISQPQPCTGVTHKLPHFNGEPVTDQWLTYKNSPQTTPATFTSQLFHNLLLKIPVSTSLPSKTSFKMPLLALKKAKEQEQQVPSSFAQQFGSSIAETQSLFKSPLGLDVWQPYTNSNDVAPYSVHRNKAVLPGEQDGRRYKYKKPLLMI